MENGKFAGIARDERDREEISELIRRRKPDVLGARPKKVVMGRRNIPEVMSCTQSHPQRIKNLRSTSIVLL